MENEDTRSFVAAPPGRGTISLRSSLSPHNDHLYLTFSSSRCPPTSSYQAPHLALQIFFTTISPEIMVMRAAMEYLCSGQPRRDQL
jgi:hypothetical protein